MRDCLRECFFDAHMPVVLYWSSVWKNSVFILRETVLKISMSIKPL